MKSNHRSEDIDITPQLAAEWLKQNRGNRPISLSAVRDIKEAINAGEWQYNSEPIVFADTGRLLNGQHRLMAIRDSGKTCRSRVVFDMSEKVFLTYDVNGKGNRSPSDRLHGHGIKNSNVKSATISFLRYFENDGVFQQGKIRPTILLELADKFNADIDWALKHTSRKSAAGLTLSAPVHAPIAWMRHMDEKGVAEFAAYLRNSDAPRGTPAHLAMSAIANSRGSDTTARYELALKVLRALECHINGESVGVLRADPDTARRIRRARDVEKDIQPRHRRFATNGAGINHKGIGVV